MVVVLVLLVTFPEESTSLDSRPKICTIEFVVSPVIANRNDTCIILLL